MVLEKINVGFHKKFNSSSLWKIVRDLTNQPLLSIFIIPFHINFRNQWYLDNQRDDTSTDLEPKQKGDRKKFIQKRMMF